ncbi:citrate synthase [Thermodesulfobacteriota bacterium]
MKKATITIHEKQYDLPVVTGTYGERAVDISELREMTGCITLDSGFQNTGACTSAITYIDGDRGVLRYRGFDVEELAEKSSFIETAYLLINGRLPSDNERKTFSTFLTENSMLHEDMIHYFIGMPPLAHPMAILSSMISALAIFYPQTFMADSSPETFDLVAARLMSKIRTIAAFSYKKSIGEPFVYPRHDLKYCMNFLNMMFSSPVKPYAFDHDAEKILNKILILHADHEQNCSTSTVRLVGSSRVNLYSSVCAGICALWGPLHGGANQEVIEMLEGIHQKGLSVQKVVEQAKSGDARFRLYGFGHRVYKNYDPRAKILKQACKEFLAARNVSDPLLNIALELEDTVLHDDYFIERRLYPNVDFYSGIIYRELGIPVNMFTVMFAIGRMPGWIAHWKEMHDTVPFKIGRPRQIYVGEAKRHC